MKERLIYIPIKKICIEYKVSDEFVNKLEEFELIEISYDHKSQRSILDEHVVHLEKCIRLHQDLNINVEGIHAVRMLQERIHNLEAELQQLRSLIKLP